MLMRQNKVESNRIMRDRDHTIILLAKTDILSDECLFNAFYKTVTEERRKKTDKYRFPEDKYLSLGAEVLLYEALNRFGFDRAACKGGNLSFITGENGKPYIEGHGNIFFNISHSGDYVMCAVSDREVGCDIQKMGNAEPGIAERFFLPREYEAIVSQPEEEMQRKMFYRYWTLKESYLKVTGRGMSLPLDEFEIRTYDMTEPVTAELVSAKTEGCVTKSAEAASGEAKCEKPGGWFYFREFEADPEYCCAICIADRTSDAKAQTVDLRDSILISGKNS